MDQQNWWDGGHGVWHWDKGKRNYLEQLLTEASTHVLTADFKKKNNNAKQEKREKAKHYGNVECDKQSDK